MEEIAERGELEDGHEGKPYLGSTAAMILSYEPPQTQDAGTSSQVSRPPHPEGGALV